MLEIIAIIISCRQNKILAIRKGLKPVTWILNTIGAWLVMEFAGISLGIAVLGIRIDNFWGLTGIGVMSGFGGYLMVRAILEKKPDHIEEDINRIGVDDLQPPKK